MLGEGRLMKTDLPARVHWAFVDPDDEGDSGVFEVTPDDRYVPVALGLRSISLDESKVFASGSPESIARALNMIFEHAWAAGPAALTSSVQRLFRHVSLQQVWRCPDHWLPSRAGPWADLVLWVGKHYAFRPDELVLYDTPVSDRPAAYVRHFALMRRAHRAAQSVLALHSADGRGV